MIGTSKTASFVYLMLICLSGCAEGKAPSSTENKTLTPPPPIPKTLSKTAEPSVPGVMGDRTLMTFLKATLKSKGKEYAPRTHHFNPDGSPKFINRLILESSPYLLQHAHNPVNWRPWSDEAFVRAKELGRPVLLSVGYSTCHWCHVMERESFEDVEIARYINEHFIAIKVDREERPDVDDIYMSAVHLLHGRGGWPMTVVMTPDREPFFGGTYFPARDGDRGARKGFLSILNELSDRFTKDKAKVVQQARQITARLQAHAKPRRPGAVPGPEALQRAAESFARRFDPIWGGFGRRPKFPRPVTLDFLIRYHRRTGDAQAMKMASLTLTKMAAGGMNDQVGGGFHRYSTDTRWLVPHFEKMLYDNAQLVMAYVDAWQISQNENFAETARITLDYVAREMTHPLGGFYSATDADSPTPSGHREEGWFFTWTPDEIRAVAGPVALKTLRTVYGVTDRGNFEGRNIPFLPRPLKASAQMLGRSVPDLKAELKNINHALYTTRAKRPPPILDDKILTSWNGLMIAAFARAGRVLKEPSYTRRAERAADFVLKNLVDERGRLLRTWRNGASKLNGYLDDYAFLISGLIELYESSGQIRWFKAATRLQSAQDKHYSDPQGGYFTTSDDHERLLTREKPSYDGAEPSGNSYTAMNLLRLHAFTSDELYRKAADRVFAAFSSSLSRGSTAQPAMLSALDMRLDTPLQVILVAPTGGDFGLLDDALRKTYLPNRAIVRLASDRAIKQQRDLPLLRGKVPKDGRATAYVCEEGRCERPTNDPKTLQRQLSKLTPLFRDRSPAPLSEPSK